MFTWRNKKNNICLHGEIRKIFIWYLFLSRPVLVSSIIPWSRIHERQYRGIHVHHIQKNHSPWKLVLKCHSQMQQMTLFFSFFFLKKAWHFMVQNICIKCQALFSQKIKKKKKKNENHLLQTVLALTVKIRKSQDFLAPISGGPGDQIFSFTFRNSTSVFLNSHYGVKPPFLSYITHKFYLSI